jgi:hypothetical protein
MYPDYGNNWYQPGGYEQDYGYQG